jgi:hypothetical protein
MKALLRDVAFLVWFWGEGAGVCIYCDWMMEGEQQAASRYSLDSMKVYIPFLVEIG